MLQMYEVARYEVANATCCVRLEAAVQVSTISPDGSKSLGPLYSRSHEGSMFTPAGLYAVIVIK